MMFQEWLQAIASMLGITIEEASVLMAVVFTAIVLMALASMHAGVIAEAIAGLGLLGFFTIAGWFNVWMLLFIAILVAYLLAKEISKSVKLGGEG